MKFLFFLSIISATPAFAQLSNNECISLEEKIVSITIVDCNTPTTYALPQFNYHSLISEALDSENVLTVKGFIKGINGAEVKFEKPKQLEASLNFPANLLPSSMNFIGNITYQNLNLYNATVRNEWISRAVVTPSFYVPYVLPEQKIAFLFADGLQCKYVTANLKTLAKCEEVKIDQGQYDCECQYTILK